MELRDDKRPKIQMELALSWDERGEVAGDSSQGIESSVANHKPEPRTSTMYLMEEVCSERNVKKAIQQVRANRGNPGIDGRTVQELPGYLQAHWLKIRTQLVSGTYPPQPVKRVEIPKPNRGTRKLGIPTVVDRFVQQAVLQVLQVRWGRT